MKRQAGQTGLSEVPAQERVECRVIFILVRGEAEGLVGGRAGISFTDKTVGSVVAGTPLWA